MSNNMDEDWDLYAVVRSCKTTTSTATASTSTLPTFNTTRRENDDYLPNFESLSFGNISEPLQRLQELPGEFLLNNSSTVPSSSVLQHQLQSQQAQNLQQIVHREQYYPSTISFPAVNPQPIRPRRRKNQESKVVKQMTQDQLSTDSWAWRKYGQKPIKGSPYPRSYYRCSTSKGCCARKQVERSSTDPNIYFVSYTGDHTHPRPTHRSSLAGSTRTKFSTSTSTSLLLTTEAKKATCSSSSPVASGSSFSPSPTTPLLDGDNNDEDNDDDDDDDDDDDVLIPNLVMHDDVFNGAWRYQ